MTNNQSNSTPGSLLREARSQCGYQQNQISERLRLSVQVIIDIEKDDYSHFAAEIYIRGYLRSYARLVHLEPESVIGSFNALNIAIERDPQMPVMLVEDVPVSRELQRNKRNMIRWMGLGLLLLMVVMVVLWWHEQEHTGSPLANAANTTVSLPLNTMFSYMKAAPKKVMIKFLNKPAHKKERAPSHHLAAVKIKKKHLKKASSTFVPDYQIVPVK